MEREGNRLATKPLQIYQNLLMWFCVIPPAKSDTKWKRYAYVASVTGIFLMLLIGLIFSSAFLVRYIATDLGASLYAVIQMGGLSSSVYEIILILCLRRQILAVFISLHEIYETSVNEESHNILIETDAKCKRIWYIYETWLKCFVMFNSLSSIGSIVYCYKINGEFIAENLFQPYQVIVPWNQSTIFGYFCEFWWNVGMGEAYMFSNGVLLMLFISMCLHHDAFYNMFEQSVGKLRHADRLQRNDKQLLCKLILFQISVKDWFLETAEMFSLYVVIQQIGGMTIIALSLFQLDNTDDVAALPILFVCLAFGMFNLFLYCHFAKLATDSHLNMADCAYGANWQSLQPNFQKYFILLIADTQRPRYYHGFGIAYLNLETFTKMLKTCVTYFMAFRTLAE